MLTFLGCCSFIKTLEVAKSTYPTADFAHSMTMLRTTQAALESDSGYSGEMALILVGEPRSKPPFFAVFSLCRPATVYHSSVCLVRSRIGRIRQHCYAEHTFA